MPSVRAAAGGSGVLCHGDDEDKHAPTVATSLTHAVRTVPPLCFGPWCCSTRLMLLCRTFARLCR